MGIIRKDVFISYRRTNFPWAVLIYQHLTYRGYDVFFDYKSIDSGSFEQIITENILGRDHFIVVLSQSALDNQNRSVDWLKKEIEIALEHKRNIIPIMLEGFDFGSPDAIKFFTGGVASLKEYQGLRLIADYYEEGLERLCTRYLNTTLDTVSHPVSKMVEQEVLKQQEAAEGEPRVKISELTAQEWFERGYNAKEQDEKIRYYNQAILLNPKYAYPYNNRGNSYGALGQHEKAIADYDKAIELNPEYAIVYYNRGNRYGDLSQYEKAIADYDKAIELNPEFVMAYNNRGNSYGDLCQHEKAIADFDKAIELNPEYTDAYSNRGTSYGALGQHKKAIADFDKAIELNPEDAAVYYNRGTSYVALGQHEKAIADYDKAIELDPKYAKAYSNRGNSYGDLGQHERAIADYDKAIELNPEDAVVYYNRGNSYVDLGQHEKAIADYDKAIELDLEYAAAYYNKACCYGLQVKVSDAVIWLRRALELNLEKFCKLTKEDVDFDKIREDEAFVALIDEFCGV